MSEILAPSDSESEISALLRLHGLEDKAVALAYFSFANPSSFIGAHDPSGRTTPLIEFLSLPVRGRELLDAIASIDENGPRLLANYQRAFGRLIDDLERFGVDLDPVRTSSLGWLCCACSMLLGLEDNDLAAALAPGLVSVKADTVVVEDDGRFFFDGGRLLRSLMSYRIADVPRHVLARSVFESLGGFAVDALQRLLHDWKADAVVCAGDLFARNRILREHVRRGLMRVHVPVHLPPSQPADSR
jgi:hypothetical protein